jgi:hypothetical protein
MISRTTLDAAARVSEHASRHLLALVDSEALQAAPDGAAATSDSRSEDGDPASNPDLIPHPRSTA